MSYVTMCAIEAAECRNQWGRAATLAFLRKRCVPMRLYQIACALAD